MPSADLLAAIARAPSRRALFARAGLALVIVVAAIAAAAALNPDAGAYVRKRLQRMQAPASTPVRDVSTTARAAARNANGQVKPAAQRDGEPRPAADAGTDAARESAQVRSRKLVEWLAEIAAASERGLILAPEVGGDATARFDRTTGWEERLAALARIHGFHYSVSPHLIEAWVRPREADTPPAPRVAPEQVETPAAAATPDFIEAAAAARAVDGGADAAARDAGGMHEPAEEEPEPVALVVRPKHARAPDLVSAVAKAARAARVEVAPDPSSNSVVIAGGEQVVTEIAALVRALDIPRRRFVLEAEIVELSSTARQELGVRWSLDGTVGAVVDFPAADAPTEGAGVIVATDGAHALRARISALAADGQVRIVSRPRVVVLEGRPASIESVRILRVRFPSSAVVGDIEDGAVAAAGRAFEEIPVGVVLKVEPSMQGDGRIVLRIRAKSSTLGPPQPPDDIPEELSRMVDAEVAVGDGETAVLGGLLREGSNRSASGVPVLRSVPVLGLLFGRQNHRDEDEELVVFVTPRLIHS